MFDTVNQENECVKFSLRYSNLMIGNDDYESSTLDVAVRGKFRVLSKCKGLRWTNDIHSSEYLFDNGTHLTILLVLS